MRENDLLTLSEVADKLSLKVSTLRAWVLRRRIPYVKLGRLIRIRRADVEALIADATVPAHTENRTEMKQKRSMNYASENPQLFPQS